MLLGPNLSYGNAQAQRNPASPRPSVARAASGTSIARAQRRSRRAGLSYFRYASALVRVTGRANRVDLDVPMRQSGLALNLVPCRNGSLNFVPIRRLADEPPNGRLRV